MPLFAILTFLVAFSIEGLGTLVSVIGLSALFGANPIIIAFAIALDAGKLVVVSLLYTYWNKLKILMRTYALIAAAITMIITSAGAAGYLSGEFQKAMTGSAEITVKVEALQREQAKLEERKKQIDRQVENIPEKFTARQRMNAINQFKEEQKQVTARLTEIDKELPTLQTTQIGVEAKAGPILAIAKSFDITPEQAVKWVILVIILVFDPLAVFLIVAGNFLYEQHRKEKEAEKRQLKKEAEDDVTVVPKQEAVAAPVVEQATVSPEETVVSPKETLVEPTPEPVIEEKPVVEEVVKPVVEEVVIPQEVIKQEEPVKLNLREDLEVIHDPIDVPPIRSFEPLKRAVIQQEPEVQDFEESKFGEVPQLDLPPIEMPSEREVIKMEDLKTHTGVIKSSLEDLEGDNAVRSSLEDVDSVDVSRSAKGVTVISRGLRRMYEGDTALDK